nr:hypothetical protein 15 [Piscirickettsiaceae bacterium]
MIMLNNYPRTFNQVCQALLNSNDDYSLLEPAEALKRVQTVALTMSQKEIKQLLKEQRHDRPTQRHHKTQRRSNVVHIRWHRLGQPAGVEVQA